MTDAELRSPSPLHRWARPVAWAVGGLLVLMALAWAGVPPLVRMLAEREASALLGRDVRLQAVRFNPLGMQLQIDGLSVAAASSAASGAAVPAVAASAASAGTGAAVAPAEAASAPPLLRIRQLSINADLRSLWRLAPVIEAVQVDAPEWHLTRLAEGRYDFDDILQRLARPATEPAAEPTRFALYNLRITDGAITVDDRPAGQVHRVTGLDLGLPFLSNLDDALEVKVEPRLAFTLNGARFDTGGQATPFARDRTASLQLQLKSLDLAPWLPYLPSGLPIQPAAGRLGMDLQLQFAQPAAGTPQVVLKGQVQADDMRWKDARGQALGEWTSLQLALDDVQPLRRQVQLASLKLDGARWRVHRDAQGRLNLLPASPPARSARAAPASAPASAAAPGTAEAGEWRFALAQLALQDLQVDWHDEQVRPSVQWRAGPISLTARDLAWPLPAAGKSAVEWQLQAALSPSDQPGVQPATLKLEGRLDALGGESSLALDGLGLAWADAYLSPLLQPRLSGQLALQGSARWEGAPGQQSPVLALSHLQLDDLALRPRQGGAATLASWQALRLEDVRVLPGEQRVELARLSLKQPRMDLRRDPQGRLNVQDWLVAQPATPAPARGAAAPAAPWRVQLKSARLDGGQLRWQDQAAGADVVALDISSLQLSADQLQWPAGPAASRLQGSLQLSAGTPGTAPSQGAARRAPGRLQWAGQLGLAPLSWRGQLQAERLPVHAVAPYLIADLPLSLMRADAGWRGAVSVAQKPEGWAADLQGDAQLNELRLHARQGERVLDDELLNWQSLNLKAVKLGLVPGQKPRVEIGQASLSDFFARLVITETGQLNLTALAPPAAGASAPAAASASPGTAGVAAAALPEAGALAAASAAPAAKQAQASASAAAGTGAVAAAGAGLPVDLTVGGVELRGGRIDFSDRFIRPNYRADLTELQGSLGAFRSGSTEMANLSLKGRAAGTALLDIRGALNPTAQPLALDIQAKATDLELAPLSPYAGKYAGYAIERGKLSMDVSYRIQPDGQLEAKNQIVLNQLTFGERIESPEATKLPVLLAVALLKDRQGVIDLNLPIGGSLNDPQFSIGGLIVKVIFNLLTKAITAPFSLLAGGGGEDLSFVAFAPGTARLAANAPPVLDKVAQALTDRPSLKMTVTGASDLAQEREAMQAAQLEARLLAEQRKQRLRAGEPSDAPLPPLDAAERARLLAVVYGDTKLPNKPRNLVGLAKDLPAAEMEQLLKAAIPVTADSARELALQRGLAVRDALLARGLPAERLFLAAPRVGEPAEAGASWTPRAQLGLGTQ